MKRASDLTAEEQAKVRAALVFLRLRMGGWAPLAKALCYQESALSWKRKPITASLAFRTARLAGVGVDDLLAGAFPPPGTCPHCGHREHREE